MGMGIDFENSMGIGMGILIIDGDGEGPAVLQVLGAAVAIGQGSLNGHGSLGVVGQLGVVLGGAVPCVDTGIIGIHTGGHDAVVVVAVDGLIDVVAGFFQIHLVGFLIGDGVLQRLGIAQQAGVDAGEAVHHVIAVLVNGLGGTPKEELYLAYRKLYQIFLGQNDFYG